MANVALIANIADQTAATRTGTTSSLVPSGVIFPYAGSTTPSGWIVCDGTAYSQADYPELFAALGNIYNTQINPTTGLAWIAPSAGQFRVPDMRGLFLRGEGTASGGDAVTIGGHQGQKTAKNGIGAVASGTSLTASVPMSNGGNSNGMWHNGPSISAAAGDGNANGGNLSAGTGGNHTHTVTITGDNETRPVNRGVRYIIKV